MLLFSTGRRSRIMKRTHILFTAIILFAGLTFSINAQDKITAAVAANFTIPFGKIATAFEEKTDIKVEATYTSTGKLYAQITQGAPFNVFLAADEKRPALLFKDGIAEEPFVYAKGRIVVWSQDKTICAAGDWKKAVTLPNINKIAIANTEAAPYGTVSMIALKKAGLWDVLKEKYVFPQTIAQSFQYASTASVDIGFCALSSAMTEQGGKGCYLSVEEAPDVVQAACILKRDHGHDQAGKFAEFLLSKQASDIKSRYGYR